MKAIIQIDDQALRQQILDQILAMAPGYYQSPIGAGRVLPDMAIPGVVGDDGRHPLGRTVTDDWTVWTRSSGAVIALRPDGQLRVAGSRHSVAEIVNFGAGLEYTTAPNRRPQFTVGAWYKGADVVATVESLESQAPDADPLRPAAG